MENFQSPGQALNHFLKKKEWTQEDLSYILSISLKHTNEIIKDKKPLSLDTAKLLASVFTDLSARDWINLGAKYQLSNNTGDDEKEKGAKFKADIYKYMPVNELIKKGWIKRTDDLDKEIRKFWNISKEETFDLSFIDANKTNLEFRKSEAYEETSSQNNILVWHQMVLNFAKDLKVPPYNKKDLIKLMNEMHMFSSIENGIKKFLNELNQVGVKFVILSHLSKTYLDGAAFTLSNGPVVALTGRHDRVDNFWFTLAHELSHVVLHLVNGKQKIFVDDTTKKSTSIKEQEANSMAEETLLQNRILQHFANNTNYITEEKVSEFSLQNKIHPSIVVGLLRHNELASYSTLNRFKESVKDQIPDKYKADKWNEY